MRHARMRVAAMIGLATVTGLVLGLAAPGARAGEGGPATAPAPRAAVLDRSVAERLSQEIDHVAIREVSARKALEWWQNATGVSLVIRWDKLEAEGFDPERSITLEARRMPAVKVLRLLLKHACGEGQVLMVEATPWYLEVLSREQVNAQTVTRVYDIRDLLQPVPNFEPPPPPTLGTGRGTVGLAPPPPPPAPPARTAREIADELADLIRKTIEPDLWKETGGKHGSISYFDGRLIILAPEYVHAQIGGGYLVGGTSRNER